MTPEMEARNSADSTGAEWVDQSCPGLRPADEEQGDDAGDQRDGAERSQRRQPPRRVGFFEVFLLSGILLS